MYNLKSQKSFLGMKSFWDFLRLHMNTPFNMHSWFWCKLNISGYVCIHVNSVKVTAPTITNVYKITEEVLPQFIITYKYKILSPYFSSTNIFHLSTLDVVFIFIYLQWVIIVEILATQTIVDWRRLPDIKYNNHRIFNLKSTKEHKRSFWVVLYLFHVLFVNC